MATIPFSTTSAFNASKSTLDGTASNDTLSFSGSSSAVTIGDSLFTGFAPTNPIEAILLPSASTNRVSLGSAASEWGFTSIFGGAQSDYISAEGYGTSGIVIYDLAGSNTLIGSAGDDLISGASSVGNLIQGLGGNDTIIGGSGNDSLDGGAGDDKLEGKSGNDLYTVDSATDVVLELSNGGTDSVLAKVSGLTLAAQIEWLLLDSTIGSGTGNSLANTLVGNSAANTLDGGTGIDSLVGLGGNDYYIVDSLGDVVLEASMSGGTDSVEARLAGYTLAGGTEVLILANSNSNGFGNSLANTLLGNSAANTLDGGVGNDSMIGGLGNDYYLIDSASDTIHEAAEEGRDSVIAQISGYTLAANTEWLLLASKASSGFGNSLANTLVGNSAANTLDGGLGADSLVGGSGSDLYLLDDAGDIVFESLSGGTDSVLSKVNHTLAANVEVLTLSGTAAEGFGNSLANTLIGNSLANTLDGATGADSMAGQGGNDYYFVDTLTDIVLEDSSGGTDSVLSKISGYTLGANLEVLILHGSVGTGTGNSLANTLIGNSAANTLDGGVGNDSMSGGLGNDYYVVDSLTDNISENSASGTDSVLSKISGFTLAENLEVLILDSSATSGTGNSLANTLVGNSLANTLDGGDGADSMTGSAGADFYIVDNAGDVVSETLPGEIDTVISSINYTLSANVERLTLTGTAASGSGNSLANTLTGNSLANTLDGGAGNDSLVGLAGNDYYIIDGLLDAVVEAANGGTDSVLAKFSGYSLASNVEVLLLDGNTAAGIGNSLNNSLIGNSAANSLSGGIGNDTLLGLAGNDFYIVDSTSDVVLEDASAGADSILAQVSGLTLAANVEVLILDGTLGSGTGNSLANTLLGNSVANTLDGGTGNDSLSGGLGNDLYIIDSALDVILEGTGTDVDSVRANTGAYTLAGNVEWLLFGQAMASGVGNSLSNTIVGNSLDNTLDGVSGSDSMVGGAGDDYYISNNSQNLILEEATGGIDTVASGVSFSLGANIEYLVLTGSAAVGVGNSANNTLLGNISSNTLDGGTGADSLAGGVGSDYYIIDNASDSIFESTGGGTDSVLSKISGHTLQNELEVLILSNSVAAGTGNTLANTLIGNSAGNTLDGGAGIDSLVGLAGNDYYIIDSLTDSVIEIGAAGTDSVLSKVSGYTLAANAEWLFLDSTLATGNGNSLANTLVGNSTDNTLDGSLGNDSMAGLAGDDYYIVDSLTDVILESLTGGGTDSVLSKISGYTLAANTEWLLLASTISSGTGNSLANTLVGNSAANTLNGGTGIDSLAGLAGNDYYIIDNLSDVILEAASGGTDSVRSHISGYALGAELEVLVLGDSVAAGTGNSAANTLVGNSAANTLDGGAGNDSLVGLAGNDYYIVDSLTDSVVELTGTGTDSVRAKISGYTLAANTEWLLLDSTLASGIGNSLANTLVGNSADNTLDGSLGNDSMSGLSGDDYYIVDSLTDVILESLTGGGTDSVLSRISEYTLAANAEWLLLASTIISGTGNSLANTLVGNSAANTLNGGAGIDSLAGLAGNDYYIIDNLSDEILEAASGGTDSVFATVSGLTLSDNLEVLILGGSAAVGSGNSLANTLVGNSASNTLNGGTGNDSLAGLAGNDYYIVDSLTDTILEASNEGTDSILSQISGYTLSANTEWLLLDATVASGIGNSLANTLVGNSAANTLNGGAGADSLSGGAGDDYYIIDNSADVVLESASSGTDIVQSSLDTYTLANHVEVLILSAGTICTGNSLANTLVGNSLANTLGGATGSDSLSAGAGNDRLVGCAISANGGRSEKDTLTGGAGTDIFVLGDSVGAFYNDGNATNTGEEDFAYITDFTIGSDILRLKGTAEQYTLGAHTVAGLTTYQGLYLELGATDELIAIIQTTASTPTIGSLLANAEFV